MQVTPTISYYVLNLKYNKIRKEFSFKTSLEKISSNPLHYITAQISLIIYFKSYKLFYIHVTYLNNLMSHVI